MPSRASAALSSSCSRCCAATAVQPGLLYGLFGPLSGQVTDPQQQGTRYGQDEQGGDDPDARGGAEPRMAARPLPGPLPERGLGGILQRAIFQLALDIFLEFPGGLVAPGRVGLEAMVDDRFHPGRDARVQSPQFRESTIHAKVAEHILQRAGQPGRRRAPGQQLAEDDPEAVEVAPDIPGREPPPECRQLFGGHIRQGAPDACRRLAPGQLGIFGEVEVQQHRLAFVGQEDVGGLEVPVDDAPGVRVGQAIGQPRRQPEDRLDIGQALEGCAGLRGRGDAPAGVRRSQWLRPLRAPASIRSST